MISILIIDDDDATRARLRTQLEARGDMQVVAEAENPIVARRLLDRLTPDVITLDLLMPRMDGITFLQKLMAGRPMPVVVVSTITQEDAPACLDALALGAVAVVGKVTLPHPRLWARFGGELRRQVRAAAMSVPRQLGQRQAGSLLAAVGEQSRLRPVMMGASTGGTEALLSILSRLPKGSPPIAIVQHMPAGFTASFAARLNDHSAVRVKEATDGDLLEPGVALLAPGHAHMEVTGSATRPTVILKETARVNLHRPSVDCLFHSAAHLFGAEAVGVLLTGMGDDGARGLAAMHAAGATTLGQDQASCVVYGMPAAAAARGACTTIAPLDAIPALLLQAAASQSLSAIA
ncbi:MAG: chemotaxis-specific protein-glutamate methyltransferase CheB [Deltaproteobacteria bacterium]|nr:chemotaxis-specific protein-glutamate methyltransferase CheB [Deltaproteobacteria bacterium]PIX82083.1 MAG: chemotaxis response regulator protein-glutamate methylesterase [Nitrospirae bacterium CG_4_10_14_3_um_filter_70_108]HBB40157.1 chemotaxis response regulator protein-glutamate methylesterase [Pseudomonadota bacterium]